MTAPRPRYFKTANAFREWLAEHHSTEAELVVGFYKKSSGKPSITYAEALGEALAIGWFWVANAKTSETRERRLSILLEHSRKGERIPPLAPYPKPKS